MQISKDVARRFLLGRQGLWPGRRWRGLRGTEQAMRTMEHLQLDPLQVIARAQDLALASRVIGYHQDDWQTLTYERRRFFEWGGWLAVRPMDELPYYRVLMRRESEQAWLRGVLDEHGPVVDEMRDELRRRRTVANRDFALAERTRVDSYRGRKDSSRVLYYLWRTGEAMIHRRDGFERVYAPASRVAPPRLLVEHPEAEAEDYLIRKAVAAAGLSRLLGLSWTLSRTVPAREVKAWRERGVAEGSLIEVEVDGVRARYHALASDQAALDALVAGRTPRGWKPLETSSTEEATFLSPLDPVVHDRDRARAIFDFDYKWEVYDKVEKRKFGYYVLPILWGDRLVGRFDAKLDRTTSTLVILGIWFEAAATAADPAFLAALRLGMARFLAFLDAHRADAARVADAAVRAAIEG